MSNTDSGVSRWLGLEKQDGEYVLTPKSFIKSVGGFWGLVESAIPAIGFSVSFGFWRDVVLSVAIAVSLTVVIFISQVVRKRPVMNAISSLFGIAIAAWLALAGGASGATARDFYLKDFFTTSAWAIALAVSISLRRPVLGYVLNAFSQVPDDWRNHPIILRRMSWLTLLWIGLFLVRLGVQLPLYLANQVVALGLVKTVLGLPLYGLWLWLTALFVRRGR